jgi:very-short-patch-repair endonuclease
MRSHKSSKLHLDVSALLTSLGVAHENECVAGGLSVDILLVERGLIIEVDGPSHYLRGGSSADARSGRTTRVNGFHAFKDRLLKKQGFEVLHIPYYEWDSLAGAAERGEYLKRGLSAVAVDE